MSKRPGQPDGFTRLQVGFGLVAAMALLTWVIDPPVTPKQHGMRILGTAVGVAGLAVTSLLRLAKSQQKLKDEAIRRQREKDKQ